VAAAVVIGIVGAMPEAAARHRQAASAPAWAPVFEAIVLDAATGQVLSEANADAATYPASLTKMMTLYLTFEALNAGRLRLDQYLPVSAEAASRQPSKLGLSAGESVLVRDLILGIVTKSANDAAVVLAEALGGGSEAAFAEMMTRKARQLGMMHTYYRNASGLPDPGQQTTARDVARLALALYYNFPREYRYFSTREFEFRGETFTSHNHMLDWYEGLDGIKTGYINASGFNIAVSAVRNGRRLIGVVMGGHSWRSRDNEMAQLLDRSFAIVSAPGRPAPTAVAAATPPAAPASDRIGALAAAALAAPERQEAASPSPPEKPNRIAAVAAAAFHHLAPMSRAEAAPAAAEEQGSGEGWGIQVGAFRGAGAAERAARHAGRVANAKGKPAVIVPPSKHEHVALYRARLAHFTQKTAEQACVLLHKKRLPCTVVPPGAMRVASK
jgi:D-alanyl-D-alanine carboxypeptidase